MRLPVFRIGRIVAAAAGMAVLAACAPTPRVPMSVASVEGLEIVPSPYYGLALARPGVDFSRYRAVILEPPEIAYRTPDRSLHQFPLSEDQKNRFRDVLAREFAQALGRMEALEVVSEPAPGVLDLRVRVQDVVAAVPGPGVGSVGRAAIALEAAGEATLVLELRDAESEEILARVYDQRAIEGIAILENGQPVTRWEDAAKLAAAWAETGRKRLEALVGRH